MHAEQTPGEVEKRSLSLKSLPVGAYDLSNSLSIQLIKLLVSVYLIDGSNLQNFEFLSCKANFRLLCSFPKTL